MSVITEAALRVLLKDEDLEAMKEYRVEKDVIVTPSARAWLVDNKVDLIIGDKRVIKNPTSPEDKPKAPQFSCASSASGGEAENSVLPAFEKPARFESLNGGFFEEKPEHMTALYGSVLTEKDHPHIILRGKIDSLQARIIEAQLALRKLGQEKAVADLAEVLAFTKEILRCEVLSEELPPMLLFGMDEAEIRVRSHTPKKYYGITHFAPSVDDGEAVVLLNGLRTEVREAEISAYQAFKDEAGQPKREDICRAFNRLSSAFYVMMFRAKTGEYAP